MRILKGLIASPADAYGILRFDAAPVLQENSPPLHAPEQSEEERFRDAVARAIEELAHLETETARRIGNEEAAIFGTQKLLAADEDFTEAVFAALARGASASCAVKNGAEAVCRILEATDDEYLKRRTGDVRDVAARILRILSGAHELGLPTAKEPIILAATDLPPSRTATLDPTAILGIVTEQGSILGHTAILARTLKLPALVSVGTIPRDWEGKAVLLRASTGELILEPSEEIMQQFRLAQQEREEKAALLEHLRGKENETVDGHRIIVYANAATIGEIRLALENDADGIGLFRSELLFLSSDTAPDEEAQFRCYRDAAQLLKSKKLIIRTLDIGSDKRVSYFDFAAEQEKNPALGVRGIRFSLAHPALFSVQLRAILRASVYGNLSIMLPMITTAEEIKQARQHLEEAKQSLRREGKDFCEQIELGIMIETPAAALIADILAKEVDFFSIGTNDLTQYTLAADRENPILAQTLPPDHEALFRLIDKTIRSAHEAGIWCGICGELGSDPVLTARLIRMGIDELSVLPSAILPIRSCIRKSYFKPENHPGKE